MNLEIGTEAPKFLFWEYLFQIFGILSLQCGYELAVKAGLHPVPESKVILRELKPALKWGWSGLKGAMLKINKWENGK